MELNFPHNGYHKGSATTRQPPGTSPHLQNVRSYDQLDDRARGGQRPPVRKWSTTLVSGVATNPVVDMVQVEVTEG